MQKTDDQNRERDAYSSLQKQIEMLIESERQLRTETNQLARALKSPI